MQNKKIIAIPLIIVIALATVGFAYALLSQTLTINGTLTTGELDWEFVRGYSGGNDNGLDYNASWYPTPGIERLDKDIGNTTVTEKDSDGDGDLDALEVNMTNVYPWYAVHVAFRVHCSGTIPIKIWKAVFKVDNTVVQEIYTDDTTVLLDLNGDGKNDTSIWWGDNFGRQLEPCSGRDLSFDIIVLQDCPKSSTLTFTIEFMAIQWNEYYVPP
jgi:hypothetical protein